jgi:DNA-binding HxlR family transcriptional regulator
VSPTTSQAADGEVPSPRPWTDPQCPVGRAADLLGDRWSLLIVRDAFDGARSFMDFQRSLGVARNILSDRLRRLVEDGILKRQSAPSGRRQQYVLTDAGEDLFTLVAALRQWGERHAFAPGEPHSILVENASGDPIPLLRLERPDGSELTARNTHVQTLA